ncbi:MAG: hypothetical protein Q8K55_16390 [Gemmatimonadaceae bacterium]|nr:hypothetical protein [Gemmatimonadaceae bacterium]
MLTFIPKSRRAVALALCSLALFAAACHAERSAVITEPPPPPPPGDSIAARYVLSSVNDQPLPVEVYAGLYLEEGTGISRDVRVIATEGYVQLRADGTFEQRVKMQVLLDGQLSGRPVYGDHGKWRSIPYSDLVRFESEYSSALGVFHGIAHNRKVWLSQEITGGEAGAVDNDFIYVRQ